MDPSFSTSLAEEFATIGVAPRLIGEDPWQWRLGAMTLLHKRGANDATLRYARVPVARGLDLSGAAVLAAYKRALERLARESRPQKELHAAYEAAYAVVANANAVESGRPVGIMDLHAELARTMSGRYRRVQFAYDMARLRRENALSFDGGRIDLGIATGSAASRKSRVLWIEDESGSGSYYSSFRILRIPTDTPGDRGKP